jgi:hypothetical protein
VHTALYDSRATVVRSPCKNAVAPGSEPRLCPYRTCRRGSHKTSPIVATCSAKRTVAALRIQLFEINSTSSHFRVARCAESQSLRTRECKRSVGAELSVRNPRKKHAAFSFVVREIRIFGHLFFKHWNPGTFRIRKVMVKGPTMLNQSLGTLSASSQMLHHFTTSPK